MVKIKNKHHQRILEEIKKNSQRKPLPQIDFERRYVGTNKSYYPLKAVQAEKITKRFLKESPSVTSKDFFALLDSLFSGRSHQEVTLAGRLLGTGLKFKKDFQPVFLEGWLDKTCGWCEVDSLCGSDLAIIGFPKKWPQWQNLLTKFSRDKNIHKRRASLVLLVVPVRESDDERLAELALVNIDKLKGEKDVLITKAVSWLLRSLIKHHRVVVTEYLKKNWESLPKIAVRETMNKLKSGRKSGN